jgi:hypothetical protein
MLLVISRCAAAAIVWSVCLFGQATTVGSLPLTAELTATAIGANGKPILSVRLRNTSHVSITACVLNIGVVNSTGKRTLDINKTYITGMGGLNSAASHSPAASWTEEIELPIIPAKGVQQSYQVSVDYVRTTDSKQPDWGPDRARQSQFIVGATAAYKAERFRLRRLLQEKGHQALIDDLNAGPKQ